MLKRFVFAIIIGSAWQVGLIAQDVGEKMPSSL